MYIQNAILDGSMMYCRLFFEVFMTENRREPTAQEVELWGCEREFAPEVAKKIGDIPPDEQPNTLREMQEKIQKLSKPYEEHNQSFLEFRKKWLR
jgi:hypothetical protein